MWPKIDVANPSPETRMAADLHQQMLLGARRLRGSMRLHTHVIAQCSRAENVIPAPDLKHGNGDLRKVFLDRPLLPVLVVIGMREPIVIVGSNGGSQLRVCGQLSKIKN